LRFCKSPIYCDNNAGCNPGITATSTDASLFNSVPVRYLLVKTLLRVMRPCRVDRLRPFRCCDGPSAGACARTRYAARTIEHNGTRSNYASGHYGPSSWRSLRDAELIRSCPSVRPSVRRYHYDRDTFLSPTVLYDDMRAWRLP